MGSIPGMSFPPHANIFAPPWMGFTPIISGIRDIESDFDLQPVAVPAGSITQPQTVLVNSDGDFLVRGLQFVVTAVGGAYLQQSLRVRIRDGDGRLFTEEFIPIVDLSGPVVPAWPLRAGTFVNIEYQNIGAVSATVWAIFKSWKRKTCSDPASAPSPYVPLYKLYTHPSKDLDLADFEYPFVFTSTGAIDDLRFPLQTDADADFLWRGVTGDWNVVNNDVETAGDAAITFYDAEGLPMMGPVGLTSNWGSLQCGLFRESVLASGGGRPAPLFPEIFIPRGGVVSADISFGSAQTVRFSLRGCKVYGHCK